MNLDEKLFLSSYLLLPSGYLPISRSIVASYNRATCYFHVWGKSWEVPNALRLTDLWIRELERPPDWSLINASDAKDTEIARTSPTPSVLSVAAIVADIYP